VVLPRPGGEAVGDGGALVLGGDERVVDELVGVDPSGAPLFRRRDTASVLGRRFDLPARCEGEWRTSALSSPSSPRVNWAMVSTAIQDTPRWARISPGLRSGGSTASSAATLLVYRASLSLACRATARLRVKTQYDPTGSFRFHQSLPVR
jgi:hypothetical protein